MKHAHKRHSRNKGFSLVEIIVVIAVMAILAAIAIPTFAHFINKANMASDIDFMNKLERAIIYASATQDDVELTKIVVVVNTYDNRITKITYTLQSEQDLQKLYPISIDADSDLVSNLAIDWDYEFQALDSIDDAGTMENQNWKTYWSIETVTINPWDNVP